MTVTLGGPTGAILIIDWKWRKYPVFGILPHRCFLQIDVVKGWYQKNFFTLPTSQIIEICNSVIDYSFPLAQISFTKLKKLMKDRRTQLGTHIYVDTFDP